MQKLPDVGHEFKDESLLINALTHSSYSNERRDFNITCYERQEFLGDAVLGMICAEFIYHNFPEMPEGELSKLRASVVCEKSLHELATRMNLGTFMRLGRGEEGTGGRQKPSVLADAVEAILAAIYLDGGMKCAKKFILPYIKEKSILASREHSTHDFKTTLQEIIQKNRQETLTYRIKSESGPDHDKEFSIELLINSNIISVGNGHSKKEAEQDAARQALELMGE